MSHLNVCLFPGAMNFCHHLKVASVVYFKDCLILPEVAALCDKHKLLICLVFPLQIMNFTLVLQQLLKCNRALKNQTGKRR